MQIVSVGSLEILSAVQTILKTRHKKIFPLIMATKEGRFGITDAEYRAAIAEMTCTGFWQGSAEVNGHQLRDIIQALQNSDQVSISKEDRFILIEAGKSTFSIKRLDAENRNKTKRKKLPHKGKVAPTSPPAKKRAEYSDTWAFSARVPLPDSAYSDREKKDLDRD